MTPFDTGCYVSQPIISWTDICTTMIVLFVLEGGRGSDSRAPSPSEAPAPSPSSFPAGFGPGEAIPNGRQPPSSGQVRKTLRFVRLIYVDRRSDKQGRWSLELNIVSRNRQNQNTIEFSHLKLVWQFLLLSGQILQTIHHHWVFMALVKSRISLQPSILQLKEKRNKQTIKITC